MNRPSSMRISYDPDPPEPDAPRKERNCPKCQNKFTIKKLYQIYCSETCEVYGNKISKDLEDKKYTGICSQCHKTLRKRRIGTPYTLQLCEECKKEKKRLDYVEYSVQRNLKNNEGGEKSKKGLSFEELNRRAEYRRVMDEKGWDHFLKGRKWDKI